MSTVKAVVLAACAAGLVLALGGWVSVGATTWYVDQNNPNASDSGPGSQTTPYKTISKGTAMAQAGDTVSVNAGRYYESVSFANVGTATQSITRTAAPWPRPTTASGQRRPSPIPPPGSTPICPP